MNTDSRVFNSVRNICFGFLAQVLTLILSFAVRTFFIRYLSDEYLGVNGLFTNILTILSLAEMGFGAAIEYTLYKPLAENNQQKIQALMNLYARVYSLMGIAIATIGISLIPFMDYLIKEKPSIEHLVFIYVMFLANAVLSYFFAYKRSILMADQKEYINSQYRYLFSIFKSFLQIVVLIVSKNFILFFFVQMLMTLAENISINRKVDRMYPFLAKRTGDKLPKDELKNIFQDVKSLFISKLGNIMVSGTDNLIISAFLGVIWVGKYSNYTLITGSLIMVLSQISTAITASVGNIVAKEDKEKQYSIFKVVGFAYHWMYGFSTICLIILLNPFITLWIGERYTLSPLATVLIAVNFFIDGQMALLWLFRSTMGLFQQGKYRNIICGLLNLVISIGLVQHLGLAGVLLGTALSRIVVNLWYDPYVIYKYSFGKPHKEYYLTYLKRAVLIAMITIGIAYTYPMVLGSTMTITTFILLMMTLLVVPNLVFYGVYHQADEFKYFEELFKRLKLMIWLRKEDKAC